MNTAGSAREFLQEASSLLASFNDFAASKNLSSLAIPDHIGFRRESHKTFEAIRSMLERDSAYIYQSIISHRPIAIVKLNTPIGTSIGPIAYLELADQKPDNSQVRDFDHIEMVPKEMTVEELKMKLESAGVELAEKIRPHHKTYDIQLPKLVLRLEKEPLITKIKREEMT